VISTASFGGVTGSAGRAESARGEPVEPVQGFGVDSTTTASPLSSGQTSNILWGAAAAAAVGAFVAEWQRKREEAAARAAAEEAARREADRAERIANLEDKHPAPLSYGERAKAYQRALDNFKADLIASGVDPVKAQALKSQAIVNGSITSVLGKAEEAKEQAKAEKEAEQAKQEAYEDFKEGERDTTAADAWLAQQAYEAWREGEWDTTTAEEWMARQRALAADAARWAGMAAMEQAREEQNGNAELQVNKKKDSLEELKNHAVDYLIAIRQFGILSKISFGDNVLGNKTIIANVPEGEKINFRNYLSEHHGLNLFGTGNVNPETINQSVLDAVFNTEGKGYVKGFFTAIKNSVLDFGRNLETFRNKVGELGHNLMEDIKSWLESPTLKGSADELVDASVKTTTREVTESSTKTVLKEVGENALKSGPLDVITTVGFNVYDYGFGDEKDKGVGSQEFWVSTGVDLAQSLLAGLVAAALVATGIAVFTLFFPAAVVAAPVALALTAGLAMVFDITLNVTGINRSIKDNINKFLDS